jgi:hypothetical protein
VGLLCAALPAAYAQHTRYEFGASFASGGQYPFISDGSGAFFGNPIIWNLRAQIATDFIQSGSIVLERVAQTSTRQGLWSRSGNLVDITDPYNANITEHLAMYAVYAEMNRTIARTDFVRLGFGVSLGYAIGSADATAESLVDHTSRSYEGSSPWSSLYLAAFLRARFTVFEDDKWDIGLTATARYWSMPTLGPVAVSMNEYNGPNVRAVHELGYLAGVSVGIKKWSEPTRQ